MMLPKTGGPDVFRPETDTMGPRPADAIRVNVKAAGINWADVQQRLGLYRDSPPRPYAPGYEVAGTVAEAPADSGYKLGDRIVAMTKFGGYTTCIDVDARGAARIPDGMSLEEAVAVPVVWLTAHEALHERARIRSGESFLVHGGAGGVGLAAIALGKKAECTVAATAGGPHKKQYLEEHTGVDVSIDYQAGPWYNQLLDRHGKVDFVLDPVGGQNLRQSVRAVNPGGWVIAYGASATAAKGRFSPIQALRTLRAMKFQAAGFMMHNTGVVGLYMLPAMEAEPDRMREAMESMMQDMVAGDLPRPVIAKTFALTEVAEAHRYLQSRAAIGKVVLTN